MTRSNDILGYLVKQASIHGEYVVRAAIRDFNNRKRRAIAQGRTPTKRKAIPKSWIRAAHERQKYLCAICGNPLAATAATGDHLEPLSTGGAHTPENIVAVHGVCNSSKGNRTTWEDQKKRNQSALERIKLQNGTSEENVCK